MPEDWMGRVILSEREFKAKLPEDFEQLISVKNMNTNLHLLKWDQINYFEGLIQKPHIFHIRGNMIYFDGGFSRWWIIRVFQKGWNNLFPTQYELKYVRARIPRTHILQYPLTEEECFKS